MRQVIAEISEPTTSKKVLDDTKPDVVAEEEFYKIHSHIPANLNALSVSRDIMLFVSDKDDFNRIDLVEDNPEELHLEREIPGNWESSSVWMEPRGRHAIIALGKETFFYNYVPNTVSKPMKFKPSNFTLPKVTAVAWDEDSEGNYDVFLGCANGVIYTTYISNEAPFRENSQLNEVAALGFSVSDIVILKKFSYKTVLATTSYDKMSLKMWCGSGYAKNFMTSEPVLIKDVPAKKNTEERKSLLRSQELNGKMCFGWLTDIGFLFAELGHDLRVPQATFYQFSEIQSPISFVMTPHHLFFLYPKSIVGISRLLLQHYKSLKPSIDWQQNLKSPANGIVEDQTNNRVWIYHSNPKISSLTINNETQNLWHIYFQIGNYEAALKQNISSERKQMIYEKQIEKFEKEKSYIEMAKALALSSLKPFAEVCLKFIHLRQTEALIEYLRTNLTNPDLKYVHAARRTILATWLLELYLKRLDDIGMMSRTKEVGSEIKNPEWRKIYDQASSFLKEQKDDLEKAETIVFQLLSTYNQYELIRLWTELLNSNHEKLIEKCIQNREFDTIFEILKQRKVNLNILYEQGPILMHNSPQKTIEVLKSLDGLDLEKLIPTLVRCGNFGDQVIGYLETAIRRSKTPVPASIHNLLLTRYANSIRENLEEYIRRPTSNFTLEFGLQFCLNRKNLKRSVALIYAKMEMYDEAVETALVYTFPDTEKTTLPATFESGLSLAKEIAKMPKDIEKRKQLMKQIVECLINNNNLFPSLNNKLIQSATQIVQQHPDLLSIEDIIKDLPDEMLILAISAELCQSINQSKTKISDVRKNMESIKKTQKKITEEYQALQKQKVPVPENTQCGLSGLPIKGHQFSHFRDGYSFINQALVDEASKYSLYKKLTSDLVGQESEPERKKINSQLYDMTFGSNPFYADHLIDTIDAEFETGEWK